MPNAASKILLAEDNTVNARLIVVMLEKSGYEVTVVGDGEKAVATCRIEDFDAVLMDVNMPVMGGLEATRQIREGAAPMRDVMIVALTADDDGATYRECIESGMNAFVTKPVEFPELLKVLDGKLGKGRRTG